MYAMSHQSGDSREFEFSRRTVMKASGVAAGGSILGWAAAGSVAAATDQDGYDVDFANAGVQKPGRLDGAGSAAGRTGPSR